MVLIWLKLTIYICHIDKVHPVYNLNFQISDKTGIKSTLSVTNLISYFFMVQSFFPDPPLIRPGGVAKNGLKKDVILSHSLENRISLSTAIYGDLF